MLDETVGSRHFEIPKDSSYGCFFLSFLLSALHILNSAGRKQKACYETASCESDVLLIPVRTLPRSVRSFKSRS